MRIGKDLVQVQDWRAPNILPLKLIEPPCSTMPPGNIVQNLRYMLAIYNTCLHCVETLIIEKLFCVPNLAETLKLLIVRGSENEVSVFALHDLVRDDIGMTVAYPSLSLHFGQVVHSLVLE